MQKHMKTSQKQTSLFTEEQLTYLQGDSHVNHIAQQESDLGKKTAATSGRKCLEQFKKLNRDGLLAKTLPGFLLGMTDWSSEKCVLTWKMKGTKSKHLLFQLVPLVRRTEGIGFGLLPTPLVSEIHHANRVQNLKQLGAKTMASRKNGSNRPNGLTDWMDFNGLLPTPTTHQQNTQFKQGNTCLQAKLIQGLLPTPQASDWKGSAGPSENWIGNSDLAVQVHEICNVPRGKTSQLNPQFVAEMMGFPINWTELPFLNGETNPSKDTETL